MNDPFVLRPLCLLELSIGVRKTHERVLYFDYNIFNQDKYPNLDIALLHIPDKYCG